MNRFALYLAAIVIAGVVTVKSTDLCGSATHCSEPCDPNAGERIASHENFRKTIDASITALEKGEITLAAACEKVKTASQQYYPAYLSGVNFDETGSTESERVARNLIAHVQNRVDVNPALAPRLRGVERELDEMIREQIAAN